VGLTETLQDDPMLRRSSVDLDRADTLVRRDPCQVHTQACTFKAAEAGSQR